MSDPFVSVLVVTLNGRAHLETCLPSLLAQDYPRDRYEILVVDNASTDGSVELVRQQFSGVGIVAHRRNLGFAGAYHAAIPTARGELLAFLNNDTRVEPSWLSELVRATRDQGAAAAGSKMLGWDGSTIDFCGGIVSLLGHAWQDQHGHPASSGGSATKKLLFACGGAMLVDRAAYDDAGGFDPEYFAYFEDVDLGWRMALRGHTTVLAPTSIVYHRVHGTSGRHAYAPRLRLYERNALRTIYKCLGQDLLDRTLPVAVALTVARGLRQAGPAADRFPIGAKPPDVNPVSRSAIATLLALEDFALQLDELDAKRQAVQSRRIVSDETLLPLFVDPLRLHDLGEDYERLAGELFAEFGLDGLARTEAIGAKSGPTNSTGAARNGVGDGRDARMAGGDVREIRVEAGQTRPVVSIVILTALGPTHLPECLDSLTALRYPAERLEVIVVDNGSQVDPEPTIRAHYPAARLVRLESNVGFCRGNAEGARVARGDWLAFLNDDTRVDPDWITEMLATAERHATPCVGARILDWYGERIDFAGASMNFEGKGFQVGFASKDLERWSDEQPLLFACGAAMIVRRDLFLETGGFDEALFAYYEDLAFGWQLWVRGHEVWLSPRATVYHRHHGTSGKWMEAPRVRLYERNSLRNVFVGCERRYVGRVLTAALLLSCERALVSAGLAAGEPDDEDRPWLGMRRLGWRLRPSILWQHARTVLISQGAGRALGVVGSLRRLGVAGLLHTLRSAARFALRGRQITRTGRSTYLIERGLQARDFDETLDFVDAETAARIVALNEWLATFGEQRQRRAVLQHSRRRSDRDIVAQFGSHWTKPVSVVERTSYVQLHERLVSVFDLESMYGDGPGGQP